MIYFNSDYLEGAHPSVMARLNETNMVQTVGYGEDEYCAAAREKIRAVCQAPEADVHFLVGGTQTNTTVIASILRPWQGVLSADSGHINCHEAGAIESTGHKVITLPAAEGRSPPSRCRIMWSGTGTTSPPSTLSSPAWCISLTPPRAAPCIPRRS